MNAKELPKLKVLIDNKEMAYVDIGSGETMLFLHGNPTSLLFMGEIFCRIFLIIRDALHRSNRYG